MLAGKLSEYFNVLLLEPGGSPPPATVVPSFFGDVTHNPSINYFFKSVPQTNAFLCCDGVIFVINIFAFKMCVKIVEGYNSHHWKDAWWLWFS